MPKPMFSARIRPDLEEGLQQLATAAKRPKSFFVEEALDLYLNREKRILDHMEASFAEADGSGAWISHESMTKWLKSWGTENELPPPEPDIFLKKT